MGCSLKGSVFVLPISKVVTALPSKAAHIPHGILAVQHNCMAALITRLRLCNMPYLWGRSGMCAGRRVLGEQGSPAGRGERERGRGVMGQDARVKASIHPPRTWGDTDPLLETLTCKLRAPCHATKVHRVHRQAPSTVSEVESFSTG